MKKTSAEAAYKVPLLDKIIKPRTITLPNGHTVQKPVSRTPFIAVIVLAVIYISAKVTGFDFRIILNRGYQLGYILGRIFHPNWSYFGGDAANTSKLFSALFDTIKMSIMGSVIGATLALVIAFEADERWLHYETRAVWLAQLLKIAGGSLIVLGIQLGVQKLLGYDSSALTLDNVTRMGMVACLANLLAITAGAAVWPMTFKKFAAIGKQ